jgi:peptidyl-prolyl cis-trans isomerase C
MNKDILTAIVGAGAISVICYGIAQMRPALPMRAPSATSLDESTKSDKVVMHVNGEPVTERELFLFLNEAPPQMQAFLATGARDQLAAEFVKLKVLEQEGKRLGAEKSRDFRGRLAYERLKETAGFALQSIAKTATDAALRAEYEKELGNLDSMELSHILIAFEGGAVPPRAGKPPTEAAAMKKAVDIEARLKKGADFAKTAAAESDDRQSGEQGGMLGNLPRTSLPPKLANIAFNLKPGEISAPVKSEFGIHIFKAGERRRQSFDAMKSRLQEKFVLSEVERLRKAAKVELDPKYFAKPGAKGPG